MKKENGSKVQKLKKLKVGRLAFLFTLLIFQPYNLSTFAGELDTNTGLTSADELPSKPSPPITPDFLEAGKQIYNFRCAPCHGFGGAGDGPAAMTLDPRPRDFTRGLFKFKSSPPGEVVLDEDLFRTISRGIPGTAMPSWKHLLSEEQRWQVAHYIRLLQKDLQPESKVVIQSRRIFSEIPMDPNDAIWQTLDRVDVRMTGQVHVPPRNQNPTVSVVTVRSVYNDQEIAFHLEWNDRVKNTTHQDSELTTRWEVADFSNTYPTLYPPTVRTRNFRDAAALQFPVRIPEGPIKPHFFLGDVGKPVNLWYWKADTQTAEELNATGYTTPPKRKPSGSQGLKGQGAFEDGQWRVVLKRPLTTEDASNDIQFVPRHLIPMAVHVWDGANGETGLRRTISSWYFVILEVRVPPSVYLMTGVAIGVAAGLEVWLIRRTQRKRRE